MAQEMTLPGGASMVLKADGWHVRDKGGAGAAGIGTVAVNEPICTPGRVVYDPLPAQRPAMSLTELRDALENFGYVAIPMEDATPTTNLGEAVKTLKAHGFIALPLAEVETLPKAHAERLLKLAESVPAKLDEARLIAAVMAAATMEDLDRIMDGVSSSAVIAVAEEKAAELTRG